MAAETSHYEGRYLAIRERDGWEYASRTNARGVAVIVPVTEDGRLLLVEQFRIPVQARVLELPAGLVGDGNDAGESMLIAAHRELEEETGFQATRMELLMECPSSAGMSDELVTFYIAEGLQRVGPGGGDESEDIEVHAVSLNDVDDWLFERAASGLRLDPKIFAALYWLAGHRRAFHGGSAATT
jgi:ADP-ribose pyrophosphatase